MTDTENIQAAGSRPSRRTIVKGAAWAVPAIAVASATPAFAASPGCISAAFSGTACKYPSVKQYNIQQLCFTNNCGTAQTFWIDHLENNSQKKIYKCDCTLWTYPGSIQVGTGANNTTCIPVGAVTAASMASTIDIYGWIGTQSGPATLIMSIPAPTFKGDCSTDAPCGMPATTPSCSK